MTCNFRASLGTNRYKYCLTNTLPREWPVKNGILKGDLQLVDVILCFHSCSRILLNLEAEEFN